jgi:hypothetical protein
MPGRILEHLTALVASQGAARALEISALDFGSAAWRWQ